MSAQSVRGRLGKILGMCPRLREGASAYRQWQAAPASEYRRCAVDRLAHRLTALKNKRHVAKHTRLYCLVVRGQPAAGKQLGSFVITCAWRARRGTGNGCRNNQRLSRDGSGRCLALVLQCMIVPSARNAGASTFAVKCLTSPGLTEDVPPSEECVDSQIDAQTFEILLVLRGASQHT